MQDTVSSGSTGPPKTEQCMANAKEPTLKMRVWQLLGNALTESCVENAMSLDFRKTTNLLQSGYVNSPRPGKIARVLSGTRNHRSTDTHFMCIAETARLTPSLSRITHEAIGRVIGR